MAPVVEPWTPSSFMPGVMSAIAFIAPDSTAPWYLTIINTLQRWFQAIAKAAHSFYDTHLKTIVIAYLVQVEEFVGEHRTACIVAGVVILVVVMAILIPQALAYFLRALGYTAHGIVEGSVAAGYQSARLGGYIAKGSWFALAQSVAAGGRCISALPWPFTVLAVILLGVGITVLVLAR